MVLARLKNQNPSEPDSYREPFSLICSVSAGQRDQRSSSSKVNGCIDNAVGYKVRFLSSL